MADNRHILQRGDGPRACHPFRDWLRRQLFGDTGISLDKHSLIFGLLFFLSMAVAAIVAVILGLGTAAILAALSAMFVLIAAFGGPLRSDLQMMAWFGPIFILAVGGVHFLTTVSLWGTIPVVVVIVFIAGLLPAFSSRYTMVSLAFVLGVLIGFGLQLPDNLPVIRIFGGIAVGVFVITLVRLVLGVGDPSLITLHYSKQLLCTTGKINHIESAEQRHGLAVSPNLCILRLTANVNLQCLSTIYTNTQRELIYRSLLISVY